MDRMDDATVTLTLPSDLVRRAAKEGLLTSERVSEWMADELKRNQSRLRLKAQARKTDVD
jgi:post-segregation antitoxin (ccd killing protein)